MYSMEAMMTDDARMKKLPVWAQNEIARLRANKAAWQREREELLERRGVADRTLAQRRGVAVNILPISRSIKRELRKQGGTMSKDRKDVYLGDGLRRALKGRKDSLSTSVNLIADRYQGIVERLRPTISAEHEHILRSVLSETRGHLLESREIAAFPSMVSDWLLRNWVPDKEDGLALHMRLGAMTHPELVALIDYLERQP